MNSYVTNVATIIFQESTILEAALAPFKSQEVLNRISPLAWDLAFKCDKAITKKKVIPLRNLGPGNLLKTELYKTKLLTVFYPETPRVPHHLTIAFNRQNLQGITSVSEEENNELFSIARKIAEIYNTLSIKGFIIAHFDTPQLGHLDRYVVEIIPHLPGFNEVKNIVDKTDCNRYILYRSANLSPMLYKIKNEDILAHAQFWQAVFLKESTPLSKSDVKFDFPRTRKECYGKEGEQITFSHLTEFLEDKGGELSEKIAFNTIIPIEMPTEVKSICVEKCFFCEESVLARQLVYQYKNILVFYNTRKGVKEGSDFLIIPKRHVEKIYGLNPEEIKDIHLVRTALVEILKEVHPECEVVIYSQDDPSVGQTVFHSHEQVVAIDPNTVVLSRIMTHLSPTSVSDQEMHSVCEAFGLKLKEKIKSSKEASFRKLFN